MKLLFFGNKLNNELKIDLTFNDSLALNQFMKSNST